MIGRLLNFGLLVLFLTLGLFHPAATNQPPTFRNFKPSHVVKEDANIGYVIDTLEADDPDDGYLIFSIHGEVAQDIIRLDRVAGTLTSPPLTRNIMNITLKAKLDRETGDTYRFMFGVTDNTNPVQQKPSSIIVFDVNDNPPVFQNLPYRAEIAENSVNGTFVYQVRATDPDLGMGGLVSYGISTPDKLFEINVADGIITLRGHLDYETEKFYQLEIMAYDGPVQGSASLTSTTDLVINVKDVQDTAPFFLNLPYIASVFENATVGTVILTVSALDGDRGSPNDVNYTIIKGQHDFLQMDAISGQISVAKPMNREAPGVLENMGNMEMTILTQEVTNQTKGPTTAEAPATIRILDVNDQSPTFNLPQYSATVLENTQQRIPVTLLPHGTEINVRDYDEGDNGRFQVLLEQAGNPFNVFSVIPNMVLNEANLLITVQNSSALDYEIVKEFSFEIVARETKTAAKHSGRAVMTVHLEDINDNWPEFSQEEYTANIKENSPRGTFVTNITATDKDSGKWGQLTYMLRGASAKLFRVDPATGVVTVDVDADLDHTLLDREKQDKLFITFEAVDGGGLRSGAQLEIRLLDENDNAPEISRIQYEGYVRENEAGLERPVTVEASDLDLPPNNIIAYNIVDGDPLGNFTVDASTGEVTLTAPLDYEQMDPTQQSRFILTVMAKDQGVPPLNTTVLVIIQVEDVNDEEPYFLRSVYQSTIPENSTGGTYVTQIQAKDNDGTAPNNEVIYRIDTGAKDKFRINSQNGVITVESGADLDRDVYGKQYLMTVLAIDRGTPPMTGTSRVEVTITDVNNKIPFFDPDTRAAQVPENATVGYDVVMYYANDSDQNALLQYRLLPDRVVGWDENGQDYTNKSYLQGLFQVAMDTGLVTVANKLNREQVERIWLTLYVTDVNAQKPSVQTATATLQITLGDVNDNPPVFDKPQGYQAKVLEGSKLGTEVTRVVAYDMDKNPTAVRYELIQGTPNSDFFEITNANSYTGIISVAKLGIDHEMYGWINITVKAMDSGIPPLESFTNVYIQIEDINDNAPVWVRLENTVSLLENVTIGSNVSWVRATDQDSGAFGHVLYAISDGAQGKFYLDNTTGLLTTTDRLDRETTPVYSLILAARDNAPTSSRLKTLGHMRIILFDVNDNHPQFEKPSYQATLQENVDKDHIILSVKATDEDAGDNAVIDYSFDEAASNASVASLFGIRTLTSNAGEIFVKNTITGHFGVFYIKVVARDRGRPSLSNSTDVYIQVKDVNDHSPVILQPPLNETVYVLENAPIGTFVTQVYAEDEDSGDNGVVRYEFAESVGNTDWKTFSIDREQGNITTREGIDRELQHNYYLDVIAYDLGSPRYQDRRTLTIEILDQDDNPPRFDRVKYPPPYQITMKEEVAPVFVDNLSLAVDPDLDAVICYYIIGGDNPHHDKFSMKKTGLLWLDAPLDREKIAKVSLIIKASEDCLSNHWENVNLKWNASDASLLLVEVMVVDINDNSPRFTKKWFTAGVTDDTQHGEPVIDFTPYSVDPDEGANAAMHYYIVPPFRFSSDLGSRFPEAPFVLGKEDGILSTNTYFQADMQGYIEFTVHVNDSKTEHFDRANVSIYLLHESQRVKVILRGTPEDVGSFKDHFAEFLSNITGAIINVDMIRTHMNGAGKPDPKKTDMFIHGIEPKTGDAMGAKELIDLIDSNYISLADLFKTYAVIEVVPAVTEAAPSTIQRDLLLALILVASILGVLLIIVCAAFLICRRKDKRKLKAASAAAFGDTGLNKLEMPTTNTHTIEGSNPIWLAQYEGGWPADSDTDSKNSIDENVVEPPGSRGYDEQELTMQMHNDEYDQFNHLPAGKLRDNVFLHAALSEHDKSRRLNHSKQNGNANNHSSANHRQPRPSHKPIGPTNGSVKNFSYDNVGYHPDRLAPNGMELQSTEI